MTAHDLAVLAIEDALKQARGLVTQLEQASKFVRARSYRKARSTIIDAVSAASHLDVITLRNAGAALDACK